jgi:hypothetical protein
MADFDTYTQIGQAEDVQDEVYLISPIDNPTAAMSRTIRATGKLHEWHEDALVAAAKNAAVEGADAPADSSQAMVNKSNNCQIMTKTAEISGTLEQIDKYGRDSEMAYQLELKYGELANDEELAIVGSPDAGPARQTGSAGSATTAREMASLHSQLDASVIQDAATAASGSTAITTIPELETLVLDAHLACYNAGGNPGYLMTDPLRSQFISSFAYVAGRQRDMQNESRIVNVIDLYVSQYGELDVVLDRNQDDCFLGLDFRFLATPVFRPTTDWALAKNGDADRRQILRESTIAVLNSKAHFMVDNIPASLTIS